MNGINGWKMARKRKIFHEIPAVSSKSKKINKNQRLEINTQKL
jgi:hypothetical protein